MPEIHVYVVGEDGELQVPYDPRRRCPICQCLFGEREWFEAWIGAVPGKEMLLVMHDDCFKHQWAGTPPQRAFLPVPQEVRL